MRWIGLAGAILVLAFAVVGCGGSSDTGSEAAADTAVTETVALTDTTDSTTETSTDTAATDTTAIDSGTDSTAGGLPQDCKDLADASQKFSAAISNSSGNDTGELEATASAFEAMAKEAPDELKDDFEALGKVMTEYAAAIDDLDLEPGDTPNAEQIAKLVKLGQSLSTQDVTKASTAIAAWTTANCSPTP